MARLLTESFDLRVPSSDTAYTGMHPESTSGSVPTYQTGTIRSPGVAGQCSSGAGNVSSYWTAGANAGVAISTTQYTRFYAYFNTLPSGIAILSHGPTSLQVRVTSGNILLWNAAGSAQIGSSTAITTGKWYRIEHSITVNASGVPTTAELKLDGTVVATASVSTYGGAITNAKVGIGLTAASGGANVTMYIDDVAINNGSGSAQNSYPGDGHVVLLPAVADSARGANWTAGAGGTTLYPAVDNEPPVGVAVASATNTSQIKNIVKDTTGNYDAMIQDYLSGGILKTFNDATPGLAQNFGDATGNQAIAFPFWGSVNVDSIKVWIDKVGTPTDNMIVAVQADSSGVPSGTDLASITVAGGSLTTSLALQAAIVTQGLLSDNTLYWLVFKRSGSFNASNFFQTGQQTSTTSWRNVTKGAYNGSTWSTSLANAPPNIQLVVAFDDTITVIQPTWCNGGLAASSAILLQSNPAANGGTESVVGGTTTTGTYPTGWRWDSPTAQVVTSPSITYPQNAVSRFGKRANSTNDANACYMGVFVEYTRTLAINYTESATVASVSSIPASITESYTPPSPGSNLFIGFDSVSQIMAAESFLWNTTSITQISVYLIKYGTPGDSVKVALQADSSGNPSGTDLAYATISGSSISSSTPGQYDFAVSTAGLTPGATYWIVVSRTGAIDTSNYYAWYYDAPNYANGVSKTFSSGAWTTLGGPVDFWFIVTASPPAYDVAAYVDVTPPVNLFEDFGSGSALTERIINNAGGGVARAAETFSFASDTLVNSITLKLLKTGSPSSDLQVELWDTSSGTPNAFIRTLCSIPAANISSGGPSFVTVPIAASFASGVTYALVLRQASDVTDASNYYSTYQSFTDLYANGASYLWNGSGWVSGGSLDQYFAFNTYTAGALPTTTTSVSAIEDYTVGGPPQVPPPTVHPLLTRFNIGKFQDIMHLITPGDSVRVNYTDAATVASVTTPSSTDTTAYLELGPNDYVTPGWPETDKILFGTAATWIAQKFVPTANGQIDHIQIGVARTSTSPTDNLVIEIRNDNGSGRPGGTILSSYTITPSMIATGFGDVITIPMGAPVSVTSGTNYWVVFHKSGADNFSQYFSIARITPVTNGTAAFSNDSGGTWSLSTDRYYSLIVNYTSTTTTPGSVTAPSTVEIAGNIDAATVASATTIVYTETTDYVEAATVSSVTSLFFVEAFVPSVIPPHPILIRLALTLPHLLHNSILNPTHVDYVESATISTVTSVGIFQPTPWPDWLPVIDNFNRPDEAPLSDRGKWVTRTGSGNALKVLSQVATNAGTSGVNNCVREALGLLTSQVAQARIVALPANGQVGILARVGVGSPSAGLDGYSFSVDTGPDVYISKHVGGVENQPIAIGTGLPAIAVGDMIGIRVTNVGSNVIVEGWLRLQSDGWVWKKYAEWTDSGVTYGVSPFNSGYLGLMVKSLSGIATGSLDDFQGGPVVPLEAYVPEPSHPEQPQILALLAFRYGFKMFVAPQIINPDQIVSVVGVNYVDSATVSGITSVQSSDSTDFLDTANTVQGTSSVTYAEIAAYVDASTAAGVTAITSVDVAAYVDGVTCGSVTTPSSTDLAADVDTTTVAGVTTPSSVDVAAFVDASTVASATTPSSVDVAAYVDGTTVSTVTSLTSTDVAADVDASTPTSVTTITSTDVADFVDSATVAGVTTILSAELYGAATVFPRPMLVTLGIAIPFLLHNNILSPVPTAVGVDYIDSATISSVTTLSATDIAAYVESFTVAGVTTPTTIETEADVEAATVAGVSSVTFTDIAAFVDAGTVSNVTSLTYTEIAGDVDAATVNSVTTITSTDVAAFVESATVASVTTITATEFQITPYIAVGIPQPIVFPITRFAPFARLLHNFDLQHSEYALVTTEAATVASVTTPSAVETADYVDATTTATVTTVTFTEARGYAEFATISSVTTITSTDVEFSVDSSTITGTTTPISSDIAAFVDANLVSTKVTITYTELFAHEEVATLATITSITYTEFAAFVETRTIPGVTTVTGQDFLFHGNQDFATVTGITTISAFEIGIFKLVELRAVSFLPRWFASNTLSSRWTPPPVLALRSRWRVVGVAKRVVASIPRKQLTWIR